MQCLEVQIALFGWLLNSVPQLCVYIFAILCAISGIFNWFFHLNPLYFDRNTTLLIKSGHTAFTTSLSWDSNMICISAEYVITGTTTTSNTGQHVHMCLQLNSKGHQPFSKAHVTFLQCQNNSSVSFMTMDHSIILLTFLFKKTTIFGSPPIYSSF